MKTLHAIGIIAFAVSPALAQDFPARVASPVFVPPPVLSTWTGCYVGGFGAVDIAHVENTAPASGAGSVALPSTTTRTSARTVIGTRPFIRRVPGGFQTGNAITTRTTTTAVTRTPVQTPRAQNGAYGRTLVGGDGGGRVGCNYQTGRFVLGAQLEGGYLGLNGTTNDPSRRGTASAIGGGAYGAVTGRIGYAVFDRTLVYARGGVGYADLKFSAYDPILRSSDSVRGSQAMPLVGAGIEYKLTPHVSATGEYTYMRPGCRTVGFASSAGAGPSTSCVDKHMVALGLNYYFGP